MSTSRDLEVPARRGFLSALPSWRFWSALIIGLAVTAGAFSLASAQTPAGQPAAHIVIDDPRETFDEQELVAAVADVGWGRPVRVLISTLPASEVEWTYECARGQVTCLQSDYPSHFTQADLAEDAVVLWVDPERDLVSVAMGGRAGLQPADLTLAESDLGTVLTYRASSGNLTPQSISDGLQVLADAESDAHGLSWATIIISVLAGAAASLLSWLILTAAWQRTQARRKASGFARLSPTARREIAEDILTTYRQASATLDDIKLIAATPAGDYQAVLDARINQYRRRYVEFARALFQIENRNPDSLSKASNSSLLESLARHATIVREAGRVLRADDRVLRTGHADDVRSHPSFTHLRTALDAAGQLAEERADSDLVAKLAVLAEHLERVSPENALADFDALAQSFSDIADPALVAYFSEHGKEYERRPDIEDPFRYRTLEMIGAGGLSDKDLAPEADNSEGLTREEFDRELNTRIAAARQRQASSTVTIPVSPLIVTIAAGLALAIGALFLWINPFQNDPVTDTDPAAVTIPETMGDERQRASAITIPTGNDLMLPSSVEVVDKAGLFADPQALEKALAEIPMPSTMSLVVLTTKTELPEQSGRVDEAALTEIFPRYLTDSGNGFIRVIPDETAIVWYADSGTQSGFDLSSSPSLDPDYDGYLRARGVIGSDYPSFEVKTWDTLASFSTGARGIGTDGSTSTVQTGASNVGQAVLAAVISFAVLLVLLPALMKPLILRRRRGAWEKEISSTISALTLAHDALRLDMAMTEKEHRYGAEARFARWDRDYLDTLQLTAEDSAEVSSLEEKLALVRTVREQAESLWRIRPILERQPTWLTAWENDSAALYAALDGASATRSMSELAPQLTSGALSPAEALQALDEIARNHPQAARLRALEGPVRPTGRRHADGTPVPGDPERAESGKRLMADAGLLASTSVFALANRDEIDPADRWSSGSVREIEREREQAAPFFSFDTSAWAWLVSAGGRLIDGFFRPLRGLFTKDRHHIQAVLLVYFVIFVLAASGIAALATIFDEDRDLTAVTVSRSDAPLSVTVIDDGGQELSDDVIAGLEDTELGIPAHVVLYTTTGLCGPGFTDHLSDHVDTVPWALTEIRGQVSIAPSAVVFCLGDESVYAREGTGLRISANMDRLMEGYGDGTGGHEQWLRAWMDDPDRGALISQHLTINIQYDMRIR